MLEFTNEICQKSPINGPGYHNMNNRSNQALRALRRILRVTELNSRELARKSELTASQLLVLRQLGESGATLPSAIARSMDLKQATVTVLVNKLEDAGLVTRRRDTEDRRRVWVELTDAGNVAQEKSPDLLQSRFEQGFEGLEEWEQAMMISTLERVASILDAKEIEAAPVLDVGDLDRTVAEQEPKSGS